MNKLCQVYYIGISDFLDRIKNKGMILITLFMMYVTYLFFPSNNTSIYYTLTFEKNKIIYRGIYNSLWMGWVSTIAFISVITLVGFYFINNSIKRERDFLIGEISASMSIKSWIYVIGKAFGNFMFLLAQMLIVILITAIMQFVRGESYSINIIKFLTPFVLLGIPICLIVSVIAVAFEIIPFLHGSFGNIAYFFVWIGLITISMLYGNSFLTDVFGMKGANNIVLEQVKSNFKILEDLNGFKLGSGLPIYNNVKTFVMNSVNIKSYLLVGRFFWICIAFILLLLISFMFRRSMLFVKKSSNKIKSNNINSKIKVKSSALTPIFENKTYSNSLRIISSKLKIIFRMPSKWWYILVLSLSIGVLFSKGEVENKIFIPLIWVLPIFIWSKIGILYRKFNMEQYLLTYRNYRESELIHSFIAAFLFTIIVNLSILAKFILSGNFRGVIYVLIAAFFVVSCGVFIGNITGSSTVFEVSYTILWYIGILNGSAHLDFLGLTQKAASINAPIPFFIVGIFMLALLSIIKLVKGEKDYEF